MIYIIIGRDNITGNEWVLSETFDSSLKAAEKCNYLNGTTVDTEVYRVDTVEPSEGVTIREAFKLKANGIYGRKVDSFVDTNLNEFAKGRLWNVGDPVEYADTDSLHDEEPWPANNAPIQPLNTPEEIHAARNRKPFTARELFPSTLKGVMVSDCIECGAYVRIPKHRLHAEWHNKIADL